MAERFLLSVRVQLLSVGSLTSSWFSVGGSGGSTKHLAHRLSGFEPRHHKHPDFSPRDRLVSLNLNRSENHLSSVGFF